MAQPASTVTGRMHSATWRPGRGASGASGKQAGRQRGRAGQLQQRRRCAAEPSTAPTCTQLLILQPPTCMLDPSAMLMLRSILFFTATNTACGGGSSQQVSTRAQLQPAAAHGCTRHTLSPACATAAWRPHWLGTSRVTPPPPRPAHRQVLRHVAGDGQHDEAEERLVHVQAGGHLVDGPRQQLCAHVAGGGGERVWQASAARGRRTPERARPAWRLPRRASPAASPPPVQGAQLRPRRRRQQWRLLPAHPSRWRRRL